jgi:uncharacterized cupredoxin-like copper-binding protein
MKRSFFSMMLIFVFILTACGGGGPSSTIDVTLVEFTFTPSEFTVPAGQEITINATNNGAVVHDFVIMKLGETVGDDFGPEDAPNIYWQIQTEPGESVTKTFTAPTEPGEYQVVCGTAGHYMAGMIGKLIVVAGE